MNLVQQHNQNTQTDLTISIHQFKNPLSAIDTFKKSIYLGIKINFGRFLFVIFIFYFSDVFLIQNERNSAQPWNSLLYFLAMMIETIKFIGDCSLLKFISKQRKLFSQYLKTTRSHHTSDENTNNNDGIRNNQANQQIKNQKFDDFYSIYQLVSIYKFTHKNYSSAFTISKYMHQICIYLLFGWMSLKQHYTRHSNVIQLLTLEIFLLSLYISSFQIDYYLIQTSIGKQTLHGKLYNLQPVSVNEKKIIISNFKKWRQNYLFPQNIATILLIITFILHNQLDLLTYTISTVVLINIVCLYMEKIIKRKLQYCVKIMKRTEINFYSVLKTSTRSFKNIFKIFIVIQRISFVFLWFAFSRDVQMTKIQSIICGVAILLLIYSQDKKFQIPRTTKIMNLISVQYQQETPTQGKQIQCAICLKQIENGQLIKFLPCSKQHIYHQKCFQDWKKIKKECPICRYSLKDYI